MGPLEIFLFLVFFRTHLIEKKTTTCTRNSALSECFRGSSLLSDTAIRAVDGFACSRRSACFLGRSRPLLLQLISLQSFSIGLFFYKQKYITKIKHTALATVGDQRNERQGSLSVGELVEGFCSAVVKVEVALQPRCGGDY